VIPSYEVPYSEEGIYGDFTYGTPGVSRGLMNALHICQGGSFTIRGPMKVLVIGGGNCYEVAVFNTRGHTCYGIDLYVPGIPFCKKTCVRGDASKMPFRDQEFDLVYCGETLEHIPEDVCFDILSEVRRVSRSFYFTIATRHDAPYNMHINVHPAWWWQKVFDEHGFRTIHAEDNPIVSIIYGNSGIIKLRFPDGVTIYGYCDIKE
jgi:hypothetical protein